MKRIRSFSGNGLNILLTSRSTFDTVRTIPDRNRIQFAGTTGSLKPFRRSII